MSYCRKEGKDEIIFATDKDLDSPSSALIKNEEEEEEEPGLIMANGEINWNCPCLGGMASGPCGVPFRDAFSCFHYSEAEPKGSDCYEQFRNMQDCMTNYPELYPEKESVSSELDMLNEEGGESGDKENSKVQETTLNPHIETKDETQESVKK